MARTNTSQTQLFPYPYDAVFDAVLAVLPRVPSSVSGADRTTGTIRARTSPTWRSWGEALTVTLTQNQAGTTSVTLESKATFQVVDWGANTTNIEFFTAALASYVEHNLSHLRLPPPPPSS